MGMAVNTTTKLVTSGLVVALDAGNPKSYPGTGSTWYDLSGNGYNFTIDPSAWASTGSTPYMNFNGAYGIAKRVVSSTLTDVPNYTNGTVMVFCSIKPNQTNSALLSDQANWRTLIRGASNDHQVMIQNNNTNIIGVYDNNSNQFVSSGFNITTLSPKSTTQFNCWHFRLSQSSPYWSFGFNTNYTAATITDANATFNNGFCCIGGYHNNSTDPLNSSQYWGNIAVFLYYNRRLSDAEILQNINAFDNRFNINTNYDTTGPVAYWDADNINSYPGTGVTWYDLSGNGNDATAIGAPTWNSAGYFTFNASNQYFITKMSGFPRNNAPGTLVAWARTNTSNWRTIIGYGASGGDNRILAILDSSPEFVTYGGAAVGGSGGYNTWVNIVGVYNGTTMSIYVNGTFAQSTTVTLATGGNGPDLRCTIGAGPGYNGLFNTWDWYFGGDIAVCQVYNRALTGTEITNFYNSTKSKFIYTDVAAYFDATYHTGTGSTWSDLSGNGNNITLVNSPTWNSGGWFTFNGTTQWAYMPRVIQDDYTIIMWIRCTGSGTDLGLLSASEYASPGFNNTFYTMINQGSIRIQVENNTGSVLNFASPAAYNNGIWQHVVITRTKSTGVVNMYVNNVLVGTNTGATTSLNATALISIATLWLASRNSNYFGGDISYIKLYARVLSDTEVSSDYSTFRTRYGL